MSKISREALSEMVREAGCYRKECGFLECDFDAVERFAELLLASQQQQQFDDLAELRTAFDQAFDHFVDPVDDVSREWLWRFSEGLVERLPNRPLAQQRQSDPAAWRYIRSVDGNVVHDTVELVQWSQSQLHNTQKHFDVEVIPLYAAPQQPAAAIPAGYKLAPVEPTEEMGDAAAEGEGSEFIGEFRCIGRFDIAYKDALAVAPHLPLVFADDIAAAEREACAQVCEEFAHQNWDYMEGARLAAAIRARGEK